VKLAVPPAKVALPRVVEPLLKLTVPVGVPDGAETVAVSATLCPADSCVADAANFVVVFAGVGGAGGTVDG
jgi:hypothetical protein